MDSDRKELADHVGKSSKIAIESSNTRLRRAIKILRERYSLPNHGNYRDAFWELVFIIISVRTAEQIYVRTFKDLKKRFPTLGSLADSAPTELEHILQPAGLSNLKAEQLHFAARSVREQYGSTRAFTAVGRRNTEEIDRFLRDLPGVGPKVSKCVTMYACDAKVLPVDAHVWRIMTRLGYAPGGRLTEGKALSLERSIPADIRYAVHVLCISHGRKVCRPHPLCDSCTIAHLCPSAAPRETQH